MKQALLSTLLLLAAFVAQAQTKLLFEETLPEAYLVRYNTAGNGNQTHINSIVNLLAGGKVTNDKGGRPNRKPEFVVRFDQHARIAKAGDNLQLKVQLNKIAATGDVIYQGFDIGSALLPEKLNYTIKVLDGNNKVIKTHNQSLTAFKTGSLLLYEATMPDTASNKNYKLKVEGKELVYTGESLRHLQEQLSLVGAYYAAEATLNTALENVTRITPDDIDRIKLNDRKLKELEEVYADLKSAPFREKLNIREHDPKRVNTKLNQLNQVLQERRRAINHALATLDQQFYKRGVALMAAGNATGAQTYFGRSLEVNPQFAPAHFQLARLDFANGYITEAAIRARDILTRMRVDAQTAQLTLALAHEIYGVYITDGNELTKRGDYKNALTAYGEARTLCSTIGGLRCNLPALNDGEARAAYGAFRNLVEDGKRFLARNDLVNAERAAGEAQHFQQQYDYVLHEAHEADDLQNQVKFRFYLQHIDLGKRYLNEKNYAAALREFEEAQDMEGTYTFQPIRELVQLSQKAAKPVLLEKLRMGYEQAINNRLADARAVASEAVAMQTRYTLEQDTEVQARYNQLRDRIVTQECLNTQAAYDSHLQKAKELIQERKYIAADQAYQSAIKVAETKATCTIATFTAKDGREAIAVAVAYQRMLEDINRYVASNRYTEAIQRYNEAEKHYLANQVNRFGLDHISLFNFAKDNHKLPFSAAVVSHFANLREEKIAVQLLSSILDRGYSKSKSKKVQQQLGQQLALKDVQQGLTDNVKALSASYTLGNKKLKKLGKAYEKERKKLAKG